MHVINYHYITSNVTMKYALKRKMVFYDILELEQEHTSRPIYKKHV